MTPNFDAFASALGGAITGAGIVAIIFSKMAGRIGDLQHEVQNLRDNQVSGIERRVATIEQDCPRRHAQLTEWMRQLDRLSEGLTNLVGWMKKVDLKLDRISEDSAAMRADVAAKGKWLENLDSAHNRHVADREVHGG